MKENLVMNESGWVEEREGEGERDRCRFDWRNGMNKPGRTVDNRRPWIYNQFDKNEECECWLVQKEEKITTYYNGSQYN